jgi:hypothetical protein
MRACPHMPKVLKHLVASDLMFIHMCQVPLQMHPLPTLAGSAFKQAQSRKAYNSEAFILRRYSITDGHKAAALLFPVRRKAKNTDGKKRIGADWPDGTQRGLSRTITTSSCAAPHDKGIRSRVRTRPTLTTTTRTRETRCRAFSLSKIFESWHGVVVSKPHP